MLVLFIIMIYNYTTIDDNFVYFCSLYYYFSKLYIMIVLAIEPAI